MQPFDLARCPNATAPSGSLVTWQYPSTSVIFGITVFEASIAFLLIHCRWSGIRTLSESHSGWVGWLRPSPREVRPDTNNAHWSAYMLLVVLTALVNCLESALLPSVNHHEFTRIATFIARLLLGAQSVALTVALNHHRLHRLRGSSEDDEVGPAIARQVGPMNVAVAAIYVIYAVSEAIATAVIPNISTAIQKTFFWLFIVTLVLINVPSFFCGVWIALYEGGIRPTLPARAALGAGLVLRFIGSFPAPFWNSYVFRTSFERDECPLGNVLSIFDVILIVDVVAVTILTLFVWLEHRRMSLLHLRDRLWQLNEGIDDTNSVNGFSGDFSRTHSRQSLN